MKTIKIRDLIDEQTISKIAHIQNSFNQMMNSSGFRKVLEEVDKISKINLANLPDIHRKFHELADKQRNFYELANRFQTLEDKEHRFRELENRHGKDIINVVPVARKNDDENISSLHIEHDANLSQQFDKRDLVKIKHELTLIKDEKKELELRLNQALESILKYEEKYLSEKKSGGRNSYARHRPIKEKLKELCHSEMQKKRPPISALQLCKIVAYRMETEFSNLLSDFAPYQKGIKDKSGEWTKPTFYIWCNDFFKQAKAK